MKLAPILLAFALAGCGSSSGPSAPSPPPPSPAVFSGAIAPARLVVTMASFGVAMANGLLTFPQCATVGAVPNVPACWISYAAAPLAISVRASETYTLVYTVAGVDPAFIHDSPGNTADGPSTVRLLLTSLTGYRMFSKATQPVALGGNSLAVGLTPANWILADLGGNTIVNDALFNTELGHLAGVGMCFGGGFFACHGVAVSSGSATFTVAAASIQ